MMFDTLERRCPRLGHAIAFKYCRRCEGDQEPCSKVLDCWWEEFDVRAYFQERLSAEVFERLCHPAPPNKMGSLIDLIEQARERLK